MNELIIDHSGFVSVKDKPSIEELGKFYHERYYQNASNRPKNYQENYNSTELRHIDLLNDLCLYSIVKLIKKWEKKKGSMLEVGVGEGFLFSRAKLYGWNVEGIDFSSFGFERFNPDIAAKVRVGNAFKIIEDYKLKNKKFDVCIIQNVLEHIIDPRQLLFDIQSILNKDGLIVIKIPNDFSNLQLRALELGLINKQFWVSIPEHLHYFNTVNIIPFMKEMNLKILDMYSTFPIDFFLYHPGSNYIMNDKNGKAAHLARTELDLIMGQSGLEKYHKLCQALSGCNVGRDFTIILECNK